MATDTILQIDAVIIVLFALATLFYFFDYFRRNFDYQFKKNNVEIVSLHDQLLNKYERNLVQETKHDKKIPYAVFLDRISYRQQALHKKASILSTDDVIPFLSPSYHSILKKQNEILSLLRTEF